MKKICKVVFWVLMLVVCMKPGKVVYAANDDFTRATSISVNKAITDKMEYTNKADYNYYKFTLSSNGYINMSFSHAELESVSKSWNITLYNMERTSIKTMDSRGSETSIVSNNIGLPAGTYYVLVSNQNFLSSSRSTINYQLQINYVQTEDWETEFNNGFLQADELLVNQSMNGSMMDTNDVDYDYYKITIPANGYINMSFTHTELESVSKAWNITLYDMERTSIKTMDSRGSETNVVSNNIGLPAGTYYVLVSNQDFLSSSRSTVNYQLRINYVQTKDWETEFNNGFLQADELLVNQPMNGSMMDTNDVDYDYYKITIPTNGYINMIFSHKKLESISKAWNITLYDVKRTNLKTIDSRGSETKVVSNNIWLSAGEYYILVSNQGFLSSSRSTIDYSLKVSYTTPKAKIKSITAGSKKLTLKWKKLNGISGYEILTATNKKFTKNKKVTTVAGKKKTKTTVKKLKRKKTYYVKMRGYITVNGVKYYGPYSKVKKVTVR